MGRDVYLSLGSNLGDRQDNLKRAVSELEKELGTALFPSSLYETEPWGYLDQPKFLNMCARFQSEISPEGLLSVVKLVEKRLGRRKSVRWGPRLIDIDILMMGDLEQSSEKLTLPHPRMWERAFVMVPLAEIEPGLQSPEGLKSEEAARRLDPEGKVKVAGKLR